MASARKSIFQQTYSKAANSKPLAKKPSIVYQNAPVVALSLCEPSLS